MHSNQERPAAPKRIVLLYRASSKKQTDSENDIPLQRNILRPWAEQQGYVFIKELVEGGVSGFKVSAEKRDAIRELKRMAVNKEFDVLGVYMSDRLGRIAQETPLIITFLNSHGIEVVSYREGPIQCESHADKLMTYIRFWQAEGESLKTSARVRDAHEQMVRNGKLRGGAPCYGYRSVSKGTLNFKGRPVFDVEIDPEQAEAVKMIFKLYTAENYGAKGIAKALNDKGIPTQTGILWSHTTVMQVLRNKMYLGIYELDKSKKDKESILSPVMPQYVIIDQAAFDKAQEVISKNTTRKTGYTAQRVTVHGSQLLTGLLYCGECGRKFTGYHRNAVQANRLKEALKAFLMLFS
jgi:DNA invertase Pin-like site-specific DNA recombinase